MPLNPLHPVSLNPLHPLIPYISCPLILYTPHSLTPGWSRRGPQQRHVLCPVCSLLSQPVLQPVQHPLFLAPSSPGRTDGQSSPPPAAPLAGQGLQGALRSLAEDQQQGQALLLSIPPAPMKTGPNSGYETQTPQKAALPPLWPFGHCWRGQSCSRAGSSSTCAGAQPEPALISSFNSSPGRALPPHSSEMKADALPRALAAKEENLEARVGSAESL